MSELNDSRLFAEGMPGDIDAVAFEQDVSDLPEKVDRFIAEKELLRKDESVLIGLSGGADSVALLVILKQLAPRYGWKLYAAHFNHGIRGVGAEDDQLFCRDLCDMMGVPFYTETGDVPAYARENGMSIETAGRLLRYDFLGRIKEKTGCTAIAVAHHMNDNAESILLHLVRGSGLRGLIGINPRRDDVIRPLLCVMKDEIEKYLEREGIAYHTDETNLIADGSRNRIRLDVMPYLMKHINPGIVPTLCGMSELLSQDENYLAEEAREAYDRVRREDGLLREELDAMPYPIKTRVIRMALADAGAIVDIERVHVEAVAELLKARTGARLMLPRIEAWTSYDLIKFGNPKPGVEFETPLKPGLIGTPLGVFRIELRNGREGFRKDPNVGFLDYDKVKALGEPVIRTRQEGDRIQPVGAPGRRKLKDYLIDRKVDREKRGEIPLIACGADVLYLAGYASSELAKVDDDTKTMLRAEFLGRIENID